MTAAAGLEFTMLRYLFASSVLLAALCLTGCRNTTSYRPVCPTPAPVAVPAAVPAAPCCPTPGVVPPPPALPR